MIELRRSMKMTDQTTAYILTKINQSKEEHKLTEATLNAFAVVSPCPPEVELFFVGGSHLSLPLSSGEAVEFLRGRLLAITQTIEILTESLRDKKEVENINGEDDYDNFITGDYFCF